MPRRKTGGSVWILVGFDGEGNEVEVGFGLDMVLGMELFLDL